MQTQESTGMKDGVTLKVEGLNVSNPRRFRQSIKWQMTRQLCL